MNASDAVQEARQLTMEALNLQPEDVEYITEELLAEYEASGVEDDEPFVDETGGEVTEEALVCRPVAYGNRLMFRPGVVWYRNGDPGTVASYACGTRYIRRWGVIRGDQFNPIARCGSGYWYYQLCRPAL